MTILNLLGAGNSSATERMHAMKEKRIRENEELFRDSLLYLLAEGSGISVATCIEKLWGLKTGNLNRLVRKKGCGILEGG